MLSFPSTVKVYVCTVALDMRKSFDGLCGCGNDRVKIGEQKRIIIERHPAVSLPVRI